MNYIKEVMNMALSNLSGWNKGQETTASSCGTACGASDKPAETPAACGTACGASDKPAEAPAACGSACGASDK
jgi:ACGX-repeat protein